MSGIATELENELELEQELELEGELQGEFELEGELELEQELEHEHEGEHEAFFNHLAAMADRGGRSQAMRRIALAAARAALKGQTKPWPVIEGEGELGELEGERDHDRELDAEVREGRELLFERLDLAGGVVRSKNHERMRVEHDHRGGPAYRAGALDQVAHQLLVPLVHAVEIADGRDGTREAVRELVQTPDNLHRGCTREPKTCRRRLARIIHEPSTAAAHRNPAAALAPRARARPGPRYERS